MKKETKKKRKNLCSSFQLKGAGSKKGLRKGFGKWERGWEHFIQGRALNKEIKNMLSDSNQGCARKVLIGFLIR